MKINRWATFAAGCGIMASAGLSYAFSILSPGIKEQFGFSDYQIALLASVVNGGAYFALVAGSLYDSVAHRHNLGPRLVIWVGCALMFVGYGGMWAQARGLLQPSFYRMLLCAFMAGNAATFWDVAVLVTNVRNFPHDRGSVLGICKSFLGMSTSIYASVYWALFSGSVSTLPPPASLTPPSTGLQPSSIPRGLLARIATASDSRHGMPGVTGGSGSVAESTTRFMGCLALVPTGVNLLASAFVNHVPIDYHGLEQLPYEPEPQHTPSHKTQPSAALWWCLGLLRVQKSTRFTGMYCLVGLLVIFQAGAALHKGTHQEGREVQQAQMAVLLGMLSLLLLLPLSTGPLAVKSLRRAMRIGLHHSRRSSDRAAGSVGDMSFCDRFGAHRGCALVR
ncbi:Nodulin-like-domain-containing protein [Dunaliella salina]|uniref:Nodulin-like-domain-containing protein n=1 Tax=Dunaliella salina TaxID=3046 RepID=A0ABQ7GMT0_DUNSA|nr:Nodulin-like-domain-containing protein [Dunaliella salina]|eukprot:KAF5835906.1 Nodulin-like-domain-containing protein [Dunaliella salina]